MKTNDELVIRSTPCHATLTLRGLLSLEAEIDAGDMATVMFVLDDYILGADEGVSLNLSCSLLSQDGSAELVMGKQDDDGDAATTLTIEFEGAPEYPWCRSAVSVTHDQMAELWRVAQDDFMGHLGAMAGSLDERPEEASLRGEVLTLRLVATIFQYLSNEAPDQSPLTAFEEWLTETGRRGSVRIREALPLAA